VAEKGTFSSPHKSLSGVEYVFNVVQSGLISRPGDSREMITAAVG
jgi:hypothetical protein